MRYTDAFSLDRPKASVDAVAGRLKKSKAADAEIAEFFKERIRIEELYAQQLGKLAKKGLSQEAKDGLGTFAGIVESVFSASNELASLHLQLSKLLASQIENALKDTRALDDALRQEGTVSKGAKSYEEKLGNLRKAREKAAKKVGSRSDTQVNQASSAHDQARAEWARELNAFLDRAQRAEEARLGKLKDAMNNYVNAETEAYRKAMSVPDKVLVNVVSAEVSAEIEDFCAKAGVQSGGSPVAESTSRGGPSLPQFSGFGFKGLNRASSILSIGQKFNETLTSKTHHREAEQPGTRTFDSQPSPPATFSTRDQITVDEEGYRVVVHSDPFANPVNRNFEDDDDDEEGSPAPQQRIKVEIKEQAISDGAEDMAAVLSSMAEKMGVAGGGVSKRPGPGRPSASSAPDVAQTPDSPRDNASAPSQGDWPETSFADEVLQQFPPRTVQQLKLKMFVTETVNAVVDASGQISKMLIVGEVGLALGETLDPRSIAEGARFELSLADRGKIEKIVPNGSFCASYGDGDSKSFMCDLKAVAEYGPTEASALPLLKYQVSTPDSELDKIAPLIVRSRWKPEASQTSLLLLYQFNPSDASMASAVLKGVDVLVSVAGTAEVTNVQCKPSGPWNKDRRMLLWRLGDLVASAEEPGKLIARFETAATPGAPADGPGADPSVRLPPGPITVRFSCDGVLLSGADIVAGVGDRPGLESVEVVEVKRQVVAGKYVLMP